MKFGVVSEIARRYIFSRKAYSASGMISTISLVGIAVASCALICVLSVFNGFSELLSESAAVLSPHVRVIPAEGKRIHDMSALISKIQKDNHVNVAMPVIEENALAAYGEHRLPVKIIGVNPDDYGRVTGIRNAVMYDGEYRLSVENVSERFEPDDTKVIDDISDSAILSDFMNGSENEKSGYAALLSIGVAARLDVTSDENTLLEIYVPRRRAVVNLVNPSTSFLSETMPVSAVFQTGESSIDESSVILDYELARSLLEYDNETTYIDIWLHNSEDMDNIARELSSDLGSKFKVLARTQLQELDFRMVSIEKWVTFMLLLFILVIASFNIVSSLSMLIIEKQSDIYTMRSLGVSRRGIGEIFRLQSLYITFLGGIIGIMIGIVLCLLQMQYGFIKLNGDEADLVISSYPVALKFKDIILTLLAIGITGLFASGISAAFAASRAGKTKLEA